jgi:hypothetical protein
MVTMWSLRVDADRTNPCKAFVNSWSGRLDFEPATPCAQGGNTGATGGSSRPLPSIFLSNLGDRASRRQSRATPDCQPIVSRITNRGGPCGLPDTTLVIVCGRTSAQSGEMQWANTSPLGSRPPFTVIQAFRHASGAQAPAESCGEAPKFGVRSIVSGLLVRSACLEEPDVGSKHYGCREASRMTC